MSTFGKSIEINLFGESHGEAIGIIINNLPAGIELDLNSITNALNMRKPKSNISTQRREKDKFEIISGYYDGFTTGTPLTIMIKNEDTISQDYNKNILRPSHADYTAHKKYNGYQDYRGGGHFSGRLTAPIVVLGAICDQLISNIGITIGSHILSIHNKKDKEFNDFEPSKAMLNALKISDMPVLDLKMIETYNELILNAKNAKNSVGGIIETMIYGIKPGYGNPFFESIESIIAHLLFSIPSVKGVEFGKGFDITRMFGSEANDEFIVKNGLIKTKTNNSGGIQGGISNGMPITFNVAIKPTPSIGREQDTVNIKSMKNTKISLEGRHDPCIVHRVVHVINSITSYAVLEILSRKEGTSWMI